MKDPQSRLTRWALRLQPFDYDLVHRQEKEHVALDMLSRWVPVLTDLIATNSDVEYDDADLKNSDDSHCLKLVNLVTQFSAKYPAYRIEDGLLFKYIRCGYSSLCANAIIRN